MGNKIFLSVSWLVGICLLMVLVSGCKRDFSSDSMVDTEALEVVEISEVLDILPVEPSDISISDVAVPNEDVVLAVDSTSLSDAVELVAVNEVIVQVEVLGEILFEDSVVLDVVEYIDIPHVELPPAIEDILCVVDCQDKECGDDGCDGLCGECGEDHECVESMCICVPVCDAQECGDDEACGVSCGECDEYPNSFCGEDFLCSCEPDCSDKECGGDGCGENLNCGECVEFGPFYMCNMNTNKCETAD